MKSKLLLAVKVPAGNAHSFAWVKRADCRELERAHADICLFIHLSQYDLALMQGVCHIGFPTLSSYGYRSMV